MTFSNFPGGLDTTSNLPDTINDSSTLNSPDHADLHNTISQALLGVEAKLGTGTGSVPALGETLVGTGSGSADWTAISATNYNVKVFGAAGNGTTDDTTAIQNTINAAHTAGGGVVFFPPGTYKITAALTVYTHISLAGSGSGVTDGSGGGGGTSVTEINQTSTSLDCLTGTDVYDFSMSDITLNGPGSGTGIGLELKLSTDGDTRYVTLKNVTSQNFGADGIKIDTLIVSFFQNVVCYGNGGFGFNLHASGTAAATSTTFTACWAHDNTSAGWSIDHMVYSSFVSCAADINGAQGFLINNCQSVGFHACGAESNTGNQFKVQAASYNITLTSCWTFHNSSIALYVTGDSINVAAIGFHENTPTGSPTASIKVDAGSIATLMGYFVITAVSLAANTTTVVNDGAGNASFGGELTAGNSLAVTGSVLAYKSGATALIKATDSANSGYVTMSQVASGNGTIESTSAVSIVADSGSNAILSATSPQLLVQHLGGSYHNITLGHNDTDGTIGTNSGNLILSPAGSLLIPTNTITLGYAQITSPFTTTTTNANVAVGLAVTVTVPAGGRNLKLTAFCSGMKTTASAGTALGWSILESANVLSTTVVNEPVTTYNVQATTIAYVSAPSAGSHTYNVFAYQNAAGTLTVTAGTANPSAGNPGPAYILAELI